ncbi:MAG: alpha/beta hydrolase [Actinobacteria bacterium]|nr:alpha/beta hydrolase [Actinomycetota bacterium]
MRVVAWREGYISGGGTRFYTRALGHGDGVALLLHGWPETGDAWRRVAPILVDAGWRVVCPDLKGMGRSDRPTRGYDPQTLADEMAELIRHLHVRKAVLVGHDWGGAVALATAFRHPGHVRALVVINSPYRHVSLRRAWHIPLLNLPVVPEVLSRLAAERLVRGAFDFTARTHEAFTDEVIAAYAESVRTAPRSWLAYYRTMSRRAVVDRLRRPTGGDPQRLRVPTRLVWGAEDPVLPLELARRDARDLHAELVDLPGVGHFPPEEDPLGVARAILDLVGAVRSERTSDTGT